MNALSNRNILIYLPLKTYGGTEILFCRLINFLVLKFNVFVFVGKEIHPGFNLNENVTVISCVSDLAKQRYRVVIASAKYLTEMASISDKVIFYKLILWQLHPDELCSPIFKYIGELKCLGELYLKVRSLFLNSLYFKRKVLLKKFLKQLSLNKSIFVMDGTCAISNSQWLSLNNIVTEDYLPVGVFIDDRFSYTCKVKSNIINVGIVSRVSYDFKFYPILNAIQNLKEISEGNKLRFCIYVVGEGDALTDLIKETQLLSSKYFEVKFMGFIPVDLLKEKFYPSIDLSIGMGTSVLDSSSLGVPTILTSFYSRYLEPDKVKYSWLYSQEKYSLGAEYVDSVGGSYLSDLVAQFIGDPIEHSKRSYEYVVENHNLVTVFKEIESKISKVDTMHTSSDLVYASSIVNANLSSEKLIKSSYKFLKKIRMIFFGKKTSLK